MFKFLGASAMVVNTVVDFLGVAGIILFGSFIVILVVDLMLAASSEREGLFFNKNRAPKQEIYNANDVIVYNNQPAPEAVQQPVQQGPEEDNGILFYNTPYQEDKLTAVDFDKAAEEQEALQAKLNATKQPENFFFDDEEEEEEDIESIALEVARKAVKELESEEKVKAKKVYKVKEPVEEPVLIEAPAVNNNDKADIDEIIREGVTARILEQTPIIVEQNKNNHSETIKLLEEQRRQLEQQVAMINAEREKDKQEILRTLKELRDREPVVVENDNKEEEERRKLANITRMNSRLSRIKTSTRKIENRTKEDKAPKLTKQTVVTVETNVDSKKNAKIVEVEPKTIVEEVVVEEKHEKPRFKKAYYENRLEVLQKELKEVEAEFKQHKKDFGPLEKVHRVFERDNAKLRRQEAIVAKQQVSVYGVSKKAKISDAKKTKLDENIKHLKQLKDSVYACKQVIEQNKDRYPILLKNNRLLEKQITRLTEDIESVNEALKWFEENNE